jgi:hypothetical protein
MVLGIHLRRLNECEGLSPDDYNPRAFSKASSLDLHSIHWEVTGRAFKRFTVISSPHDSQIP